MAEAFIPGEFEFILSEDEAKTADDQTRTVFELSTLDEHEYAQIEDAMEFSAADIAKLEVLAKEQKKKNPRAGGIKVNTKAGSRTLSLLRIGLKGWRNFWSQGEIVPFVKPGGDGMCPWENIRRLTPQQRNRIATAIETGNTLSEEDSKN
ncbi:MAG: hypothetical protein ABID40_03640 [Candidatus Bipolaricaulota bacterium]